MASLRLRQIPAPDGLRRTPPALIEYEQASGRHNPGVMGLGSVGETVFGVPLRQKQWLLPDERGSIVAVTDGSGNATAINKYDEYGIPASTNVGRFQYTGQAWLPEIGMSYYKARMYSPTLGRFMQTDPIGYGAGMNVYNYVGGDPINATDPLGLKAQIWSGWTCGADGFCTGSYSGGGGSYFYTRDQGVTRDIVVTAGRGGGTGSGGGSLVSGFRDGLPGVGGDRLGGGRGGSREDGAAQDAPQNNQCSAPLSSTIGSARAVLETAALGADIATVGLAAGGVTGPAAVGTKLLGYAFELGLGAVNAYDAYANGNYGPGEAQLASLGARLIPGGRALQSGLKTARGPTGILRNSAGRFRSSYFNNPAIEVAGNIATQRAAGGAVEAVVCR